MNIRENLLKDVKLFEVDGRLDSTTSKILDTQIIQAIEAGEKKIALELQNLEYISSAGIRVLVHCHKHIHKKKGELVLIAVPKSVENVLYITGFLPYFKIFETKSQADAYFQTLNTP